MPSATGLAASSRLRIHRPRSNLAGLVLVAGESGDIPSTVRCDIRTGDGEDLRSVHRAHHLTTARRHACGEEKTVELIPSSRSGSHSLTLTTVGGKPATSSTLAKDGHARGLPSLNASMP